MSIVGQKERATQKRVVDLFRHTLHYEYLGNWHDRPNNRAIEEAYLRPFLVQRGYADALITKALRELKHVAGDQTTSLYESNKQLYSLLRYGIQVKADAGDTYQTVGLIDWQNPHANHFAIAEEVTVISPNTKRPDIVLYLNGIALGVLELKRSTVSVSEGIRQNLDNQKAMFIQPFFRTMQLVMAGNDTAGLRYGTIETPEKYYLAWKEEGNQADAPENRLDRSLRQLCAKPRLLELIHDFVVFDAGTKKLCRHNQYFGVKAAQTAVRRRAGGIIWHSQGSGKSLTMVWLAKWIRENVANARVLIITDRVELDEQIEKVFLGVNEQIRRTRSGQDLIAQLHATTPWLLCSLIHKFGGKDDGDVRGFITEVQRNLPAHFQPKGDLYVFVDECHRSQSGDLHRAMKQILPNAMLIGFTGTPLLQADKQRSIEVFGPYIHTYKFDEAVRDNVVLDLRYEARDIDQFITSPARIEQWFAAKTQGLTEIALAQLKQRWGTMQNVLSSQSRLNQIVADILLDMETKDRLKSGRGNAMLVSGSIYQACKLYKLFIDAGFTRCAIVTSYQPTAASIKGEESGEGPTERLHQYEIYNQMLNGQDPEAFERAVKKQFIEEPGQMKLLIVVDKLLTGFDAPSATYLYIDKPMRDHSLFQAICRVNRLDGDDKEYGYIIDYKDLFKSLEHSIHNYTAEALGGYAPADIAGLLSDRLAKARERLDAARESIKALCEPVAPPQAIEDYQHYFCATNSGDHDAIKASEAKRLLLYKLTVALLRAYANLANEMLAAGYTANERDQIKREVEYYETIRTEIKLTSADYLDMKMYDSAMRHLLDTYIHAEDSRKLSVFDDMTLIQLIVKRGPAALDLLPARIAKNEQAVAETIENNLRKLIVDQHTTNPKYYETMAELLDSLIQERREQALAYADYLTQIIELSKRVQNPATGNAYPPTLHTAARRALYDNLGRDETRTLAVDAAIMSAKHDSWRGHAMKEREVHYAIQNVLADDGLAQAIFELAKEQRDDY